MPVPLLVLVLLEAGPVCMVCCTSTLPGSSPPAETPLPMGACVAVAAALLLLLAALPAAAELQPVAPAASAALPTICLWLTTSMGTMMSCVDSEALPPANEFETPANAVSDSSSFRPSLFTADLDISRVVRYTCRGT